MGAATDNKDTPANQEEHRTVTGRPSDVAGANSTFAERAKARGNTKQVDAESDKVSDKAVTSASKKGRGKP